MPVEQLVQVGQELWVSAVDSTSLTSKKLELAEVFLTPSGNVKYHVHSPDSLTKLWPKHGVTQPAAERPEHETMYVSYFPAWWCGLLYLSLLVLCFHFVV
ncbi:BnaA02g11180D [Brassica napus]|uniref:BnaA02g11180D protein n=1 Tax=Brassica napus TaxID=3708 RepID=A0A078GR50_BRANA|nr:BnaA02g11180D [Brassica napus]